MQYIVNKLPKHLFWDSDISKLDDVENYEKIIVRTFERGDLEDMAWVMAYYGNVICAEVMKASLYLPERAKVFATNFLGVNADAFLSNATRQHHPL